MTSIKPWGLSLVVAILVAAFLLISFSEARGKSPTSDEPPHIAAGMSYFVTHEIFRANPQHPPLMKELAALSLMASGVRWPKTEQANYLVNGDDPARVFGLDWPIGNDLIQRNGADRVLLWARLPMILTGGLLAVMVYLLGRRLLGSLAGAAAVFFLALDPTMLAHTQFVTTDVGMAAFVVLFLYALWSYLAKPSRVRMVLCGLALGAALVSKFSALFLLPIGGILLAAGMLLRRDTAKRVDPTDLCPCGSGKRYKNCHGLKETDTGWTQKLLRSAGVFAIMCAIAFVVIEATYFFPSDLMMYEKCARMVNADHNPDYLDYMAGGFGSHFLSYFVVAYLLKEPIPGIAMAVFGLVTLWRSQSIGLLQKLFILFPGAVFFLAVTFFADDIGFRYMIPALPSLHLAAGLGLATLFETRWKYAAAALCAWMVVAAAGVYPDHLAYFNEAACLTRPRDIGWDGGSRCGPDWLDDSNVDWGQGLKQLKTWLDKNAAGKTVRLAAFSSYPPEAYGIRYEKLDENELPKEPKPGLYIVSAHLVARVPTYPGSSDWLRRVRPKAIIGHSLYVYEIPEAGLKPRAG
jgi:hypothetical protein